MTEDTAQIHSHPEVEARAHEMLDVKETDCCIVGAGPAGAVLALLLARKGIPVILLEAHGDFEREFRGDTIHPSVMEIMDQLGLVDRLLEIPHTVVDSLSVMTTSGPFKPVDFTRLRTRFPYIALIPQARFLEFITTEARRYDAFHLQTGASAQELIEEGGVVRGVRYRSHDGWHEVRARLVVGADGRFSQIRRLAGFEAVKTSPPMDVLWFRLPRVPGDSQGTQGRIARGRIVALLDRGDYWQVAFVIPKGSYHELHEAGLPALRESFGEVVPELAERMAHLEEWKQVALLSVESSHVRQWWRPGLLVIGDAAHVMSPVGGVGINYAIQDAVVAANVLTRPLKEGSLGVSHLAEVQRQRDWPIRFIQALQALIQKRVIARALSTGLEVPAWFRFVINVPILRDIPGRIIAFGIRKVRVEE